ncbi:MAG: hypothetical protein ABSH48_27825 [Verrucomicrobiota bacterium]|jgi:hypothetical protein
MKTTLNYLFALLALFAGVRQAAADVSWGNWQSLGNSVSVRFTQVTGTTTMTWEFRNDGATTITYMDYYYTDTTGQHTDVFPGTLKPGQVFGGWAAFTGNGSTSISIKTIQRNGTSDLDSMAGSRTQILVRAGQRQASNARSNQTAL